MIKRLNTPAYLQIKRKHGTFFIKPSPGPHPNRSCLPLLHIVRDLLQIVPTHREAKKLIGLGHFMIDGKIVKDKKFPVGLMDVLSIPDIETHYRIIPTPKYRFQLLKISEEESTFKLCRINKKTTLKGGHIQLNLHDGRNILIRVNDPRNPKEDIYKIMDVVKISLPDQEILKVLKFQPGNIQVIISGKKTDIGHIGKIKSINKRFGPYASTVIIEDNTGKLTETLYDYSFIIGEAQSEIKLPETEIES